MKLDKKRIAIALWLALLPLEMGASVLAYWTLSWISPVLVLSIAVLVNVFALFVCSFSFWPGAVLAVSYGLLLVGHQSELAVRWYYVDREAKRIVGWVYSEETKQGSVPEDLSGYEFENPKYREFVFYNKATDPERSRWKVGYFVGTNSTDHSYTPEYGWFYNND